MRVILFVLLWTIQHHKVEVLEKQQYQAMVEKGYTVIDVRTPEEYEEGHIGGAQKSMSKCHRNRKLSKSDTLLSIAGRGGASMPLR